MKKNILIQVSGLSKVFETVKKNPGIRGALESLVKKNTHKVTAVNNLDFEIERGEFVGFIGPNGAGKTTTLKMLSGILHPTSGVISVSGYTPIERKKEFLLKCALVMGQKNQLWWDLPAQDSFELLKTIYRIPDKKYNENLSYLTELLKVQHVIDVPVRKMSLGERMKCELLGALLHDPEILFLDEPTIGLDIVSQENIRQFLKKYNREKNATIILTSHYMEDIKKLCEKIIIINNGEIVFNDRYSIFTKKYGTHKMIEVEFDKAVEKNTLEKFGQVTEYKGLKAHIMIRNSDLVQCTKNILSSLPVSNISIHEKPLEEIMKEIF